jgi:hypothetical protein
VRRRRKLRGRRLEREEKGCERERERMEEDEKGREVGCG